MNRLTERLDGETVLKLSEETVIRYERIGGRPLGYDKITGKAVDRLAEYEEAEEQGRLVVLPCKVGDKVYRLWSCGKNGKSVSELIINHVDIDFLPEIEFACRKEKTTGNYWFFKATDIGKSYFLTREEAENALAERKEADDGDQS